MITVKHTYVAEIPVLGVVSTSELQKKLPTVVFYHGWTSYKESALVQGYEIAKKGFRVLIPEAYLHGERSEGQPVTERSMEFWNVVQQNLTELPILKNHYVTAGLTDPDRIGVAGLSMGGVTTSAALTQFNWIKTAVVLMGSPSPIPFSEWLLTSKWSKGFEFNSESELVAQKLELLKVISLDLQPEKIDGRPVHFWHDTEDDLVPYQPTYDFYQKVKNKSFGKNLSFTTSEGKGHHVPYLISVEMADFLAEKL